MAPYESDSSEGEDLPESNSNVLFGSPQRQQKQPQKSSRKKSSSLPDFLENSPFLPVLRERKQPRRSTLSGSTSSTSHVPNLNQILRSKRIRFISAVTLAFIIGLLIFAPRQKLNLDILHRQAPYCATPVTPRPPLSPPAACADKDIDWSRYAYVQYVTTPSYLCNSVMLFEALHRLGSKADRIMMFPSSYIPDLDTAVSLDSVEMRLLWKAKNEYGVKMIPIDIQHKDGDAEWADSYTKLLAFNQTQYERVLSLDSDSTLLQNMDELFLLPSTPVAMPRAYWLSKSKKPGTILSSYVFLVQPSIQEFERIEYAIKMAKKGDYDMEIVNDLYGQSCLVLPHRRYGLLTGEFRADDHLDYMGNGYEVWDPEVALKEAKLVHFSDWPLPKPWLEYSKSEYARSKVKCGKDVNGKEDCRSRDIWLGLYKDFTLRRKNICGPEAHTRDDEWEIGIKME